jgi:hypothetical protein
MQRNRKMRKVVAKCRRCKRKYIILLWGGDRLTKDERFNDYCDACFDKIAGGLFG